MALKKTVTKEVFGEVLQFDMAYHAVNTLQGDKNQLNVHVIVYKDEKKDIVLEDRYFTFTPSISPEATNFIEQFYLHAKSTIIDYKDAIDV